MPEVANTDEKEKAWRLTKLLGMGIELELANRVAYETNLDTEDIRELIKKGASPEVAVEILS